ncbi:MAG: aminomethyl-transferring glycine dehydrogenase [Rhodothermales bacterium]|nr:aminomethyl-transferring glycine dehydrogenase [Rhodothermales bacterium]
MRLTHPDRFADRHNGPSADDLAEMLATVEADSLDALADETVPAGIRFGRALDLPDALSEQDLLAKARRYAAMNELRRTFIGQGYFGTVTPGPIARHIFQNPNWYTQYTPYQAEIAQGRLEALLNFQTLVSDLTGLPIANASLLDEGTAAAEAMLMIARQSPKRTRFVVSSRVHPQTIDVVAGRAAPMGLTVDVKDDDDVSFDDNTLGVLLQYPTTDGEVVDYRALAEAAHAAGAFVVVATDLLTLTLLDAPGVWGADVAVGSSQRFGVPMGYGGPHAAFFATTDTFKRTIPGRIIGVTVDKDGSPALRMALQTREQHIRRDKATSNICTAQVLLAVMAQAYAVYHGPDGLKAIATYVHDAAKTLKTGLEAAGHAVRYGAFFDTLRVEPKGLTADEVREACDLNGVNLRAFDDGSFGIALDETVTLDDLDTLLAVFETSESEQTAEDWADGLDSGYDGPMPRTTAYLTHPVFHAHRTETDLMRYLTGLSKKDLSLTHSMIPLGSCTMKLNAVSELLPVSLPGFANLHPFVPKDQAAGYHRMMGELSDWLAEITGFDAVSLQPNSGASGEYAGLMVIRAYHQSRGESHRTVCLIPDSAHGTNPASAVMAGMTVVPVKTTPQGTVDLDDLRAKADKYADTLAALMVTYPSTFGVFESGIREVIEAVHDKGGQVYLDGANMNAMVGLVRPGDIGADVCHLNLHKTFAIPHGGGGPGMGPIGMKAHLAPFRPGSVAVEDAGGSEAIPAISAAPYGSASILLISWAYIAMMGAEGLKAASQTAILNANYLMKRLEGDFEIAYVGEQGRCAHEFILDLRPLKAQTGISEVDCAKRLMDYGYHAPTMSWPVVGTMMIEPTESESKAELDRFVEAMRAIRAEIQEVALGLADRTDNVLKNAPHPATMVLAEAWERPYSREKAAYPAAYVRAAKFWPTVRRVDDAFGDRNLVCTCPPMSEYAEDEA